MRSFHLATNSDKIKVLVILYNLGFFKGRVLITQWRAQCSQCMIKSELSKHKKSDVNSKIVDSKPTNKGYIEAVRMP